MNFRSKEINILVLCESNSVYVMKIHWKIHHPQFQIVSRYLQWSDPLYICAQTSKAGELFSNASLTHGKLHNHVTRSPIVAGGKKKLTSNKLYSIHVKQEQSCQTHGQKASTKNLKQFIRWPCDLGWWNRIGPLACQRYICNKTSDCKDKMCKRLQNVIILGIQCVCVIYYIYIYTMYHNNDNMYYTIYTGYTSCIQSQGSVEVVGVFMWIYHFWL